MAGISTIEDLQLLALAELPIPLWQIVLSFVVVSFFLLTRMTRLSVFTISGFVVYWLIYLFRTESVPLVTTIVLASAPVGMTAYAIFFFREATATKPGFSNFEINRLQKAVLRRIDKAEVGISEAGSKTLREFLRELENAKGADAKEIEQQFTSRIRELESLLSEKDEEAQKTEEKFKSQLREKEDLLREREREIEEITRVKTKLEAKLSALQSELAQKESALSGDRSELRDLEKGFKARISELEDELRQRELHAQAATKGQKAQIDSRIMDLEELLRDRDATLGKRESVIEALEQKAHKLEDQLKEKERRLLRDMESAADKNMAALQAGLKEKEEAFRRKEASFKEVVEALNTRIVQLEAQVKEQQRGEALSAAKHAGKGGNSVDRERIKEVLKNLKTEFAQGKLFSQTDRPENKSETPKETDKETAKETGKGKKDTGFFAFAPGEEESSEDK